MNKPLLACLAALTLAGVAACGQNDPVFDAKVRAYLMEHPEVIEEAMVKLQEKRAAEAVSKAQAALPNHRAALERDPRDFVANPSGAITVTEFFDYKCGYCKTAAPQILQLIAENPDVRFVFKELPIFGGVSNEAAASALAAGDLNTYLALHRRFFAAPNLDEAAIDEALSESGLSPAAVEAKASSPETQRHLLDNHTLASALGIEGTPTFVVGDQIIPGADMAALRAAIDEQRKRASGSGRSGSGVESPSRGGQDAAASAG